MGDIKQELSDAAEIVDAIESPGLIVKIARGIEQADAGQTLPHREIRKRLFEQFGIDYKVNTEHSC